MALGACEYQRKLQRAEFHNVSRYSLSRTRMTELALLASLKNAYHPVKEVAAKETKTTLIRVNLTDLMLAAEEELAKKKLPIELPNGRITFARAFVIGVGSEGTIIWMTGGNLGEDSIHEYCKQSRDRVITDIEASRLVSGNEESLREEIVGETVGSAGFDWSKANEGNIHRHGMASLISHCGNMPLTWLS